MAYMSQEKKAQIAAKLKTVMPKGWRYSLAVDHHSTLVLTVRAAPENIIAGLKGSEYFDPTTATHADLNVYHLRKQFADEKLAETFEGILAAMNEGNHDNSDPMSDYFDVGWYKEIRIGRWNKPFVQAA